MSVPGFDKKEELKKEDTSILTFVFKLSIVTLKMLDAKSVEYSVEW